MNYTWTTWSEIINGLSPGDFFQALSLPASMLVAWATFRWAAADSRHALVIEDVTAQLKEVLNESRLLASKMEKHYMGEYEGGFTTAAARDSRKILMLGFKNIDDRRQVLSVFISSNASSGLQKAFDEWRTVLIGDDFPVLKKSDCCKEYDAPIKAIRGAQLAFEKRLSGLRRDCLCDGLRMRKIIALGKGDSN